MNVFGNLDLGGIQRVIYPVIKSLGGPDIQGEIADKSQAANEAADVLEATASLLRIVATTGSDGIYDNDEVEAIIAAAPTIGDALDELLELVMGKAEE